MEPEFTPDEAKQLWDTHVYLKLRCDSIDLKGTLTQLEKFMPKGEEAVLIEEKQWILPI